MLVCFFYIFSVKNQKENSKNKAIEEILFIWQLLEKVCQEVLEYSESEKQDDVLYQNNSQFTCTYPLVFKIIYVKYCVLVYTICDSI